MELEIFERDFITKNKRNKTKDYSSQGKIYYFLERHYEKIKIKPKLESWARATMLEPIFLGLQLYIRLRLGSPRSVLSAFFFRELCSFYLDSSNNFLQVFILNKMFSPLKIIGILVYS